METTNTTGWWNCLDCGADAELMDHAIGYEVPCPDCAEPMALLREWTMPSAA